MVFVFRVGAEKTADMAKTTQRDPEAVQKGELDHALLLKIARTIVGNPDKKAEARWVKDDLSSKGGWWVGDAYSKKLGNYRVSIEVPNGMKLEDALKTKGVDVLIEKIGDNYVGFPMRHLGGCNKLTNEGGQVTFSSKSMMHLDLDVQHDPSYYDLVVRRNRQELSKVLGEIDKQMGEFGPRK